MSLFSGFLTDGVNALLNSVGKELAQQYLDGIIELREILIVDRKPTMVFTLTGMPDRELSAVVGTVDISEDGSSVRLSNFSSNVPFLENALNRFVTRPIPIEDAKVAFALRKARSFLF